MPIHDQSYRRYAGERRPVRSAWMVIARAGLMSFLSRKAFLGLLIVAWIPFVVRASQLFLASNFSQAATFLAPSAQTFRDFLGQQGIFVFLITIYVGAGLIANDRRANALQLYLSKPVTRAEYILGKMSVLAVFLLAITWLPAILLLILQIAFSGSFTFLKDNTSLIASVTLYCLLTVIVITFGMTALSSLSRSSRFVGIMFAGVLIFSDAMFNALRFITGSTAISWVSVQASLDQVGDVIFRQAPRHQTPVAVSFLVLLAVVVLSASVLERRVRGVEVVA
ncbi:ABC transporter permease subunit [Luteitalea sp.]|uniref:ABC transporter permease n=1 Tax=Luteitalea sp. TaxID=2004800 RepID=UPI0025BAF3B3|nr:ABC transporter permease subunit [Luteitalea sp.]